MRFIALAVTLIVLLTTMLLSGGCTPKASDTAGADFYVSPQGNDAWSGTLSQANAAETDGPFRTPARARDAVREKLASQKADIVVMLMGGTHVLDETLVFGPEDSGREGFKVIYTNYPDQEPMLSSGRKVSGWEKCETPPAGLPEEAAKHVWIAEINMADGPFYTLYEGQKRLARARSAGFKPVQGPKDPDATRDRLVYPEGSVMRAWPNIEDVEIVIRPWCLWTMNILPLARVDETARVAYTALEGSYPLTTERHGRFGEASVWVENVPEALDMPGEWMFNSREKRLYYWPAGERPSEEIVFPMLTELIRVEGDEAGERPVRNLVFCGLSLMHAERETWRQGDRGLQHDWDMYDKANAMMRFRWAKDCIVEECLFTNAGSGGLRADLHAQNIIVRNNEFSHLGGTGVLFCGYGPGTRDVNHHNVIENNHIHHIGEIYWHCSGIHLWQSGSNHIAHNLIHHTPYNAVTISGVDPGYFRAERVGDRELAGTIRWEETGLEPGAYDWNTVLPLLFGRDNVFEYNEIHHAVEVLGDGNGMYIRMCPGGQMVRRNYFHHVIGRYSAGAIRMDDIQFGCEIRENIFYCNTVSAIAMKHCNTVENNIVVDVLGDDDPRNVNRAKVQGYVKLYPSWGTFVGTPPLSDGRVVGNILLHTGADQPKFYHDSRDWSTQQVSILEFTLDKNVMYWQGHPEYAREYLAEYKAQGADVRSVAADPKLRDAENQDFRLLPDSPARELGFEPIDQSAIGLTDDYPPRLRKRM